MRYAMAVILLSSATAASGAPAARAGDATTHGGIVAAGSPNVLIGGQPAARAGHFASCPLVTGGVPHVGGPIQAGAPTVLVNGAPAARMGDLVQEQGGQVSAIATGAATVLIGSPAR